MKHSSLIRWVGQVRLATLLATGMLGLLGNGVVQATQNPFGNVPNEVQPFGEATQDEVDDEEKAKAKAEEKEKEDEADLGVVELQPVEPVDDQLVQLELWDGSLITGKLKTQLIQVDTEFGKLEVPVGRVRQIMPGLDSYPGKKEQLEGLMEALSDNDYQKRDQAQRELMEMGLMLRDQMREWMNNGDAEQKKRLKEILEALEPMIQEVERGEMESPRTLIYPDTMVTEEFTIVGKIQTDDFSLVTKFGELSISLEDIKSVDRMVFMKSSAINKQVSVDAESFFQNNPTSTRIRVRRGDRIQITADGTVNWTNWNQQSNPDGLNGQGSYQGFISGTLLARIGQSGKLHKVGSKATITADRDGILYLGIAMQDNYVVRNNSYRWVGKYESRIKVEPK